MNDVELNFLIDSVVEVFGGLYIFFNNVGVVCVFDEDLFDFDGYDKDIKLL